MRYADETEEEPPQLRRLRLLVTVLMVVLILGIVTIAGTIVIRLGFPAGFGPVAAEALVLRPDEQIVAAGQGKGTVVLTVRDAEGAETLVVFDAGSGEELSRTPIRRE